MTKRRQDADAAADAAADAEMEGGKRKPQRKNRTGTPKLNFMKNENPIWKRANPNLVSLDLSSKFLFEVCEER